MTENLKLCDAEIVFDNNITPEEKKAMECAIEKGDEIKNAMDSLTVKGTVTLGNLASGLENGDLGGTYILSEAKRLNAPKEYVALLQVYFKQKGKYTGNIDGELESTGPDGKKQDSKFATMLKTFEGKKQADAAPKTKETTTKLPADVLKSVIDGMKAGALTGELEAKLKEYGYEKKDASKFSNGDVAYGKYEYQGTKTVFEGIVLYKNKTIDQGKFEEEGGKIFLVEGKGIEFNGRILEGKFYKGEDGNGILSDGKITLTDKSIYEYKNKKLSRIIKSDGHTLEGKFYKEENREGVLSDGKEKLPDGTINKYEQGKLISTSKPAGNKVPKAKPEETPTDKFQKALKKGLADAQAANKKSEGNAAPAVKHEKKHSSVENKGGEEHYSAEFVKKNRSAIQEFTNRITTDQLVSGLLVNILNGKATKQNVSQLQSILGMGKGVDGKFGPKTLKEVQNYAGINNPIQPEPEAPIQPKFDNLSGIDPKVKEHIQKACVRASSPLAYIMNEIESHPGKVADAMDSMLTELGIPERRMSAIAPAKRDEYKARIRNYLGIEK